LIFIIFFCGFLVVGASFWMMAIISAFGVIRNFKSPAERYTKRTLWNPLNALAAPSLLTEKGLRWRRRVFIGVVGFVASLAAAGVSVLLLKLIYHHP
jgi:hypothetical protein